MQTRWLLVASACLLLQGCQPPTYDILAERRDGRILLVVRGSGSSGEDDIFAHRVTVRDAGRIVWVIQSSGDGCRLEGTTPPFPIFYGQVPNCYREMVPAQPLAENVLYRVQGQGGLRAGRGYFRLDPVVHNFEWDDVEAELRRWPELPEPSWNAGQVSKNTAAAPAAADRKAVSASKP